VNRPLTLQGPQPPALRAATHQTYAPAGSVAGGVIAQWGAEQTAGPGWCEETTRPDGPSTSR
jgi:hypothetical protein